MSLSRGQKKSGSLTRKVGEALGEHHARTTALLALGFTQQQASEIAYRQMKTDKQKRVRKAVKP